MTPRMLLALLALLPLAPLAPIARADDGEWTDVPNEHAQDGYDVSVDLDAQDAVTFDSFHGTLAPYGEWITVANHGRVWRPRVAAGWRPYYYGRWEWTNEGWLWVSDEPWGWAAYHYGRWAYDDYFGWIWVPGYEWAPAWVSWRVSGDVVGWAPLAPGFSVYVSSYPFVDFWWTFVPTVRLVSVPVYTVAYAPSYTRRWYHHTAPAPARPAPRPALGRVGPAPAPARAPAWGGPAPRLVSERIGRPLTPARIVAAPSPGARARPGEVPVYRPGVRAFAPDRGVPRGASSFAPAPGGVRRGFEAPPAREGRGRAPGVAPAPGLSRERAVAAPPPSGEDRGRGPGVAPSPGWSRPEREVRGGSDRASPPPARSDGGSGSAAPPPSRSRGGSTAPAPSRSGGRSEDRGEGRGEGRGGGERAAPSSRGERGGERGGR